MADRTLTADSLSDRSRAILAERVAGAEYSELALKYGSQMPALRAICLRAMRNGLVTPEQIRFRRIKLRTLSAGEYNAAWLARVKEKTTLSERGCWVWQGWATVRGYGQTTYHGKGVRIHRKTFEIVNGVELATEQYVCHSCDVKRCCNPDHLWLGDTSSNMLDFVVKGKHYWRNKTHCPKGHEYTPENTYVRPASAGQRAGSRACKECTRIRMARPEYRARTAERQRLKREQKRSATHV
jgi:hypothetical protein